MSTNEHFLISAFRRLIKNEQLGHGYLLFGEHDATKRELAHSLVGFLETGLWGVSETPLIDSQWVMPDEKGTISIDTIREAIAFLWASPLKSSRRTLVIERADSMAHEASQALLKTAEEPPRNGLLILLVKNPESVFPTLASRLQKIYVPYMRDMKYESKIIKEDIITTRAKEYVHEFLAASGKGKSDALKKLFDEENNALVEAFQNALLSHLAKDPIKNNDILRELLKRIAVMGQFTTNRKLQFEAVASLLR